MMGNNTQQLGLQHKIGILKLTVYIPFMDILLDYTPGTHLLLSPAALELHGVTFTSYDLLFAAACLVAIKTLPIRVLIDCFSVRIPAML